MDIKCIALDLDRTTLNAQGRLTDGNRKALEYAIRCGVRIVIASGRPLGSLPQDVLAIKGIEYAITSNGAAIYHLPSKQRIAHTPLFRTSVEKILQLTACLPYAYETFVDGKAYAGADFLTDPVAFGAPESSIPYLTRTRTPVDDMEAFIWEHADELDSIDLILNDAGRNPGLRTWLQSRLKDCYITSSVPHLLEISHRDCGKHVGLRVVTKALGLTPAQTAAFGDADNDVDMLTFAGCGVAVANASPACLAAADKVTASFDADGVAKAIYELLPDSRPSLS